MEVAWHLVQLHTALEVASFPTGQSLQCLLKHIFLAHGLAIRINSFQDTAIGIKDILFHLAAHIDDMDPSHIDNVQRENLARRVRKSDIKVQVKL